MGRDPGFSAGFSAGKRRDIETERRGQMDICPPSGVRENHAGTL